MKKFLLSGFSSFVVLFFLSLLAPALTGGSDAKADYCGLFSGDNPSATCGATTPIACTAEMDAGLLAGDADAGCRWWNESTANQNAFVDVMCNALRLTTGGAGKAFAAFAIISMGIGFFTGKISWGLMLGVAFGIGAMFGAPTIVGVISGEDTFDCSQS